MAQSRAALVFGVLLLAVCRSYADEGDPTLKYRRATVKVLTTSIRPDYSSPWLMKTHTTTSGSGAIIKGNLILTNAHVVSDATFIQVLKENDPNKYEAEVAFIGHECDLALLKVKDPKCFENTTALEVGDTLPKMKSTVATYGFPLGGEHVSITEGVVSRIEIRSYVHSGQSAFLVVQTDAAINPGNSGGPVIQDDKIVGVAFQVTRQVENMGFMIPAPILRHFLRDVADGRFDGFPDLGIVTTDLENKSYREYLGMSQAQSGILITRVWPGSCAESYLKEGDVLLRLDGVAIANDGSVPSNFGRIQYTHLVDLKQIGEDVEIAVWRDRKEVTVKFPVGVPPVRIPWFREFEKLPRYYLYAGLLFQPLNREYLETWVDWLNNADLRLVYYFLYGERDRCHPERKEFVVIRGVVPDRVNTYLFDLSNKVVDRINGLTITRLEDVIQAFKRPQGKYHLVEVEGKYKPIVLNAEEAAAANERILKTYKITADRRLDPNSGYGKK